MRSSSNVNVNVLGLTVRCRSRHIDHDVIETIGVDGLTLRATGAGDIENLIGPQSATITAKSFRRRYHDDRRTGKHYSIAFRVTDGVLRLTSLIVHNEIRHFIFRK